MKQLITTGGGKYKSIFEKYFLFPKYSFTLSEVLITLVIIGVVAAITVPSVISNIQKQDTIAKLKKIYSTLAQVVMLSQQDNGPVDEWYENVNKNSQDYFDYYIKPYLANSVKCRLYSQAGYTSGVPYIKLNGQSSTLGVGISNRTRASFFLNDIFIMIFSETTDINGDPLYMTAPKIYVDLNSGKGPNQYGKDVFIMVMDKELGVVPECGNSSVKTINNNCTSKGSGECCLAKIINDSWEINY